jgi:hypothetical protein
VLQALKIATVIDQALEPGVTMHKLLLSKTEGGLTFRRLLKKRKKDGHLGGS